MTEISTFTYYSLILLSGMGLLQSAYILFIGNKQEEDTKPSPFNRPAAPNGYRWVLMTEAEAEARTTK